MLERLLELADYDAAALLLLAVREAHARTRPAAAAPWAWHAAARVFLEYAAFLSRLQLPHLAAYYCDRAASAEVPRRPSDARQSQGEAAPDAALGMNGAEAAQLVQQLARLQEEAAMRQP